MPRGRGIYDDENTDEPKGDRPGPADDGGDGGVAREVTPDVADDKDAQEPPD